MEMESISTEETHVSYRAAGFWMRFWAYLADAIIVAALNGILLHFVNYFGGDQFMISQWTIACIFGALTFFVYFSLMTNFYGKPLGKMIFALIFIHENGNTELSWLDIIFRYLIVR